MTTSAVSGLSGGIYLGANKIMEIRNGSAKINRGTLDASNGDGGGWEECIGGLGSWTVDGEFNLIVTDTNGFLAIQTAILAGTSLSMKARSTASGYNWAGTVFPTLQQLQLFDLKNPQTVKFSFKGTGAITPAAS